MIRETDIVFDEILEDTDPGASMHLVTTYTSLEHTDFLASATQLVFQVVVDVLTTRDDVPFSITVEHSADGRNWKTKNAAPEVSGTIPRTAASISFAGGEPWPVTPSQRFARLCINAGGSIGSFAINVVIHAAARDRQNPDDLQQAEQRLPADATLFGIRREVVSEIETFMDAAAEMPHEDRYEYLARKLSPDALAELNSFQLRVRSLDETGRRALFHAAAATIGILTMPPLWRKQITQPEEECGDCAPAEASEKSGGPCGGSCESDSQGGREASRSRDAGVQDAPWPAARPAHRELAVREGDEADDVRAEGRNRHTAVQLAAAEASVGEDTMSEGDGEARRDTNDRDGRLPTPRSRPLGTTRMTMTKEELPGEGNLHSAAALHEVLLDTPDIERD